MSKRDYYYSKLDNNLIAKMTQAITRMEKILTVEMDKLDQKHDVSSAVVSDSLNFVFGQLGMVAYNLPDYKGRRLMYLPQAYIELITSALEWSKETIK